MIRVQLPTHLQRLSKSGREIELQVDTPVTAHSILDAHLPDSVGDGTERFMIISALAGG